MGGSKYVIGEMGLGSTLRVLAFYDSEPKANRSIEWWRGVDKSLNLFGVVARYDGTDTLRINQRLTYSAVSGVDPLVTCC